MSFSTEGGLNDHGRRLAKPHEAGWLTKGIFRRRYAPHCNMCGSTGPYLRSRKIAERAAYLHSLFGVRLGKYN